MKTQTKNNSKRATERRVKKSINRDSRLLQQLLTARSTRKTRPTPRSLAIGRNRAGFTNSPLSECAQKFALACLDPFDPRATDACIPTAGAVPSLKCWADFQGNAIAQANGIAFFAVSPCIARDSNIIAYTDGTGTHTAITMVSGTGVTVANANALPYSYVNFAPASLGTLQYGQGSLKGRVVACGVTAKYSGAVLTRQGVLYALSSPQHASMEGYTSADFTNMVGSEIAPIDDRQHMLTCCPLTAAESAYYEPDQGASATQVATECIYPLSKFSIASANTTGVPIMGFMATGMDPGTTLFCRGRIHIEVCAGADPVIGASDTHADEKGWSLVSSAVSKVSAMIDKTPGGVKQAFVTTVNNIARNAAPVAYKYLSNSRGNLLELGA